MRLKNVKQKIVITGGDGRFAQVLKKSKLKLNILYPNKKNLNILKIKTLNYLYNILFLLYF